MKNNTSIIGVLLVALAIVSCKPEKEEHMKKNMGVDITNMDTTISPSSDFYAFVNGGWMKNTEIPEDETRWGSFNELRDRNDKMSLDLVDKALNDDSIDPSTDEGKVVTFFRSAMDLDNIEKAGIGPITPMLNKVDNIQDKEGLLDFIIEMEPYLSGLFGIGVFSDAKNSNVNTLYLGGGNLGLPERDYYLDEDDESKEKREKYVAHVSRMLQFLGDNETDAKDQADRILAFETKMASSMLSKEDKRDPLKTYNPKSLAGLQELAPVVNWERYLTGVGAKGYKEIIVSQPDYISKMNELVATEPMSTIKEYMRWGIINDAANYLSEDIEQANFDFYAKELRGQEKPKPRNERVLSRTNRILGEALGKLYVKEYFPPKAKEVALDLVNNIKESFGGRINQLEWMSDETKEKALEKLGTFNVKIGYPDKWKDYGDLDIQGWDNGGSFYNNILSARKWNYDQDIVKIGKDVDKSEWFMPPQTVNAYYNPLYNEIVFPAAIMQAPFFDFETDAAVNYGGIGAVIGHEISHGFDDQGSQYDADGNLNNWWSEDDKEAFEKRTTKLVEQYNEYEPLEGVKVNGEFTLGENIGDLGGVNVAYDGLQRHIKSSGDNELIDGFDQNQRFFINWATVWRTKFRDDALKTQIKTDPHSPGMYRATGPIVNVDAFHEAFDIKEGDEMYKAKEERIKIW